MTQQAILTQQELKTYITRILMGLRLDLAREMAEGGEPLPPDHDWLALLYDAAGRFGLDPDQRLLVCGPETCALFDPPVRAAPARALSR